jgi:hypothetical protein
MSKRASEQLAKFFSEAAAQHQLGPITQYHPVFIMKPWLQLSYALDVDYRRAVDAREFLRVQLRFEAAYRLSEQIGFLAYMEAHVFPFSLDPINLIDL